MKNEINEAHEAVDATSASEKNESKKREIVVPGEIILKEKIIFLETVQEEKARI